MRPLAVHRDRKAGALKHQFKGHWSRRISDEHRLVYAVTDDAIVIVACQTHYV
jgi:toxin YoeB